MSINMGQYSAVCGIRVPHVLVNVDAKTSTLGSCQDQLVRQVARQKIPGHDVVQEYLNEHRSRRKNSIKRIP
jgi:hypothetical protein